jgi:genome maintenance exonuclease 1
MRIIQLPSGGKFYETPYGLFPSVTTILQATMPEEKRRRLANWRKRNGSNAEMIRLEAVERGKAIHRLVEARCNGDDPDCPPELEPFWTETRKLLKAFGQVMATERTVYHLPYQYAGTLDILAEWNSTLTLIDVKTSYRPKRAQYLDDAKLQIAAYRTPCEELLGITIWQGLVVVVSPSNTQQFSLSQEELDYYWDLWLERVEQYRAMSLYDQLFEHGG